eukprot:11228345-Lingulodinium_polyedra.AAC.3
MGVRHVAHLPEDAALSERFAKYAQPPLLVLVPLHVVHVEDAILASGVHGDGRCGQESDVGAGTVRCHPETPVRCHEIQQVILDPDLRVAEAVELLVQDPGQDVDVRVGHRLLQLRHGRRRRRRMHAVRGVRGLLRARVGHRLRHGLRRRRRIHAVRGVRGLLRARQRSPYRHRRFLGHLGPPRLLSLCGLAALA